MKSKTIHVSSNTAAGIRQIQRIRPLPTVSAVVAELVHDLLNPVSGADIARQLMQEAGGNYEAAKALLLVRMHRQFRNFNCNKPPYQKPYNSIRRTMYNLSLSHGDHCGKGHTETSIKQEASMVQRSKQTTYINKLVQSEGMERLDCYVPAGTKERLKQLMGGHTETRIGEVIGRLVAEAVQTKPSAQDIALQLWEQAGKDFPAARRLRLKYIKENFPDESYKVPGPCKQMYENIGTALRSLHNASE